MVKLNASIIVPVFGDRKYLVDCLAALEWTASDYSLVLVDNATGHDIPPCKNLHAVVRNAENLGWSGGNNAGAKCAKNADILVLLNMDTIPELDWLAELLTAFDDPDVGMAGSRLHYPDGRIQHSGIVIRRGPGSVYAENRHDEHESEEVDGVTGACMAIRRSVFDAIGGCPEEFWNGNDDVSMCIAVKELGYKIRYVSTSHVMHYESVSGAERWSRVHENVALLNTKWGL